MQDNDLDNLLRDWSNAQLPDDEKRNEILQHVFVRPQRRSFRRIAVATLSGIVAIAATLLFLLISPPPLELTVDGIPVTQNDEPEKIRVSLIVLKQRPDSDSAVEFLEDTVLVAEEKTLHEFDLDGHRLFLWIYPLEKTLFSLDVGLDNAAETGVVAVPDRPQALHLTSNGDKFDVLVSVLPNS